MLMMMMMMMPCRLGDSHSRKGIELKPGQIGTHNCKWTVFPRLHEISSTPIRLDPFGISRFKSSLTTLDQAELLGLFILHFLRLVHINLIPLKLFTSTQSSSLVALSSDHYSTIAALVEWNRLIQLRSVELSFTLTKTDQIGLSGRVNSRHVSHSKI